jgi:hypothetical protein
MKAIITYKDGTKETLVKLTEIHYCYFPRSIAFESNILKEGQCKMLDDIKEIEVFNK